MTSRFIQKQLDYSLSISKHDTSSCTLFNYRSLVNYHPIETCLTNHRAQFL